MSYSRLQSSAGQRKHGVYTTMGLVIHADSYRFVQNSQPHRLMIRVNTSHTADVIRLPKTSSHNKSSYDPAAKIK